VGDIGNVYTEDITVFCLFQRNGVVQIFCTDTINGENDSVTIVLSACTGENLRRDIFGSFDDIWWKFCTYAAVVQNGSIIHIAFNIFTAYTEVSHPVHRKVIANCIKRLYEDKLLKTNVPTFARTSLTSKDNYLLLHVVAYCPEIKGSIPSGVIDEPSKIYENEFSIKWDKPPKKAYFVPNEEKVDFRYENGRININVNKIVGHTIIAMEF